MYKSCIIEMYTWGPYDLIHQCHPNKFKLKKLHLPWWNIYIWGGEPSKWNLLIKECAFILTGLNFSHLQSTLHLMQYTYWEVFSLLKTVFELVNFDAFQYFSYFLFQFFHVDKMFLFEDVFNLRKQWKKSLGQDQASREDGSWCAHKSPIMKRANMERVF